MKKLSDNFSWGHEMAGGGGSGGVDGGFSQSEFIPRFYNCLHCCCPLSVNIGELVHSRDDTFPFF